MAKTSSKKPQGVAAMAARAAARAAARSTSQDEPPPLPGTAPGRLLAALSPRRLWRALFVDELRLRRHEGALRLELAGAPTGPTPPAPAAANAEAPMPRMRRALTELLDAQPGSRAVLRHLAALEHHLKVQQRPFIDDLSLPSLQHMLRQLQGLVTPAASPDAALLLGELLDAAERKRLLVEQTLPGVQPISSFFVDHKVEVKELDAAVLAEQHGLALFAGTPVDAHEPAATAAAAGQEVPNEAAQEPAQEAPAR